MSNNRKENAQKKQTNKQKIIQQIIFLILTGSRQFVEINLLPPKYWVITFVGCLFFFFFLMQQKENVNMVKAK